MLTPDKLHDYQKKAVNHQCAMPRTKLWLDMGLGKTAITLTSIAHLLNTGFLRGVLIVAPIRVIRLVWRQEAAKWAHTNHLTFSVVAGTRDQRTRALLRPADVYLINYENLGWLAETLNTYFIKKQKPIPFNGLVWDEVSKTKNSTTQRVKSFRRIEDHFDWVTGLTGTPASNGYKDLHGQYLVVDKGERLGRTKTEFKTRFFYKQGPYTEVPFADTEETIKELIGDITLEMSAEDYNPLPDLIVNDIEMEMTGSLREKYDKMEKEMFLRLDSDKEKELFNQAALMNTCLQYSNGSVYPVAGLPVWEPIHDLKLEALENILDEAQGNPVLCAYQFRSDAERIMTKFASLRPINLTECKSESALRNAMHRWKSGDCQLMIGHPACLHPRTQVLTETRGWVKIVDVKPDERVFDGVEFVSHDGCSYSGYKDVIDVFGVTMTPNHKLLLGDEWVEAQNVGTRENARQEALYQYEGDDTRLGAMLALRSGVGNPQAEPGEAQQAETGVLRGLHRGQVSQDDRNSDLADLAAVEIQSQGRVGQELRGTWDRCVSRVGEFRAVLRGYVTGLFGRSDHRADRREWSLLQGKLHLGHDVRATIEQAHESCGHVSGRSDAPCRTGASIGRVQNDADDATQPGNVCGRSGRGCEELDVWEGPESQGKTHVYDLVNCGPRNRFVIRNDDGEVFISHNSMGHGIDGLQDRGRHLVWFGLTWSLDLYEQFNARIRRQGQGASVICHRILVSNTLDQAQALALDDKASTQAGLRKAVKDYRSMKGV